MAISVKYFITDPNGNFIDWNQSVSGLSIQGQEAQITGTGGVDVVYVQAGASANLSELGGGNDKIYLSGNVNDYIQTIDQDSGVYTFLRAGEKVQVLVTNENDVLYFGDGHITLNQNNDIRLFDGSSFHAIESAWLTSGGTPVAGPVERDTPTTAGNPARVFITDPNGVAIPGLPQPGQKMMVIGSGGTDSVYIKPGTTVDASELGGGDDTVYLGGNLDDYVQNIDQDSGVYTLTRTTAAGLESVKFTISNENDVLYFANGHITLNQSADGRIFDGNIFHKLTTEWLTAGGTPGINHITVNVSTAPQLSGQSVISGKALANASVTVTIDPDNNAATSNSFSYAVTADASGNYSLNLATATLASGTPSFVVGTASISVAQAVPGIISPATVITLPVSTSTSYYSVSIANDHVTEGGNAVFTVTRSGDISAPGTVVYNTQNGSATTGAPGDYTGITGTLSFAAGDPASKTVTVTTIDDLTPNEGNETLSLVLSSPTGGELSAVSANATIVDNEEASISIDNAATGVTLNEGAGSHTFTVRRDGLTTNTVVVVVTSVDGSATSNGSEKDYNAVNQTLTFNPGDTSLTFDVTFIDDTDFAGNENFSLQLSTNSVDAKIDSTKSSVAVTIIDDDGAIISIDNAAAGITVNENAGTGTFSVSRGGDLSQAVTVVVQSSGGNARSGGSDKDYNAVDQTITFGEQEFYKEVVFTILDDLADPQREGNETFDLKLSNASSGAKIDEAHSSTTVTIVDNESATISIDKAATGIDVREGVGVVNVELSRVGNLDSVMTVVVQSNGGNALPNGKDYTTVYETVTFGQHEEHKSVQFTVIDDTDIEGNETFDLLLTNQSDGAVIDKDKSSVTVTIEDNENKWNLTSPGAVYESKDLVFRVTRTGDLSAPATIVFSTSGGTASTADFTAVNNMTLNFAANVSYRDVTVLVNHDAEKEGGETVQVRIDSASDGTINTDTASATIKDDDQTTWYLDSPGAVGESQDLVFTVRREGSLAPATIKFATYGGTASSTGDDKDITPVEMILTFLDGDDHLTVTVPVIHDTRGESNETVNAVIGDASSGNIFGAGTASATILDDDRSFWSVASTGDAKESDGHLTFKVSRTGSLAAATIVVKTGGGTAEVKGANPDIAEVDLTLSFLEGQESREVTVPIIDNAVGEPDKTVIVTISNPSNEGVIEPGKGTASALLVDDDTSNWTLTSEARTVEGTGQMVFTVTRNKFGPLDAATIEFSTVGGSATAGSDYAAINHQVVSFEKGVYWRQVFVDVTADTFIELDETIAAEISNQSVGNIAKSSAEGTIAGDPVMNWSLEQPADAIEGSGNGSFTIVRTDASKEATIYFQIGGGTTATGGIATDLSRDYTFSNQVVTFKVGDLQKTVTVPIYDDTVEELTEILVGDISYASIGNIITPSQTLRLIDNDQSKSSFSISPLTPSSLNEGTDSKAAFKIIRGGDLSQVQTIVWSIAGTVTTGVAVTAGDDYTGPTSGTLTYGLGDTERDVLIPLRDDTLPESDEILQITLSDNSGGVILVPSPLVPSTMGLVTLHDNDTVTDPVYSIAAPTLNSISENAGSVAFVLHRSGNLAPSTSYFRINGGSSTASEGQDWTLAASDQTVNWAEGVEEHTISVSLPGSGNDTAPESTETLIAEISTDSGFGTVIGSATVNLVDADSPSYSIAAKENIWENGGEVEAWIITRSGNTKAPSTSYFRIYNGGTATPGDDFIPLSEQTMNWGIDDTSMTVKLTVLEDAVWEFSETVTGQVAPDSSFTTGMAWADINIQEDDPSGVNTYSISLADQAFPESAAVYEKGGVSSFTIFRGGDLSIASTSYFRTVADSAIAWNGTTGDYTNVALRTISWGIGDYKQNVTVDLRDDTVAEGRERFSGQSAADSGFTSDLTSVFETVWDDDTLFGTGGANTYTTSDVYGYAYGVRINTAGGNDIVTLNVKTSVVGDGYLEGSVIDLGNGNDVLETTRAARLTHGGHYEGGAGVDTMRMGQVDLYDFVGDLDGDDVTITGFEIMDMVTAASGSSATPVLMSLSDVLEFTRGNTVADTLRIRGGAGDTLNLQALGKALSTPAVGANVIDVDGTSKVVTSGAGNGQTNDVTVGTTIYDVYQYQHDGHAITLMVSIATTVVLY